MFTPQMKTLADMQKLSNLINFNLQDCYPCQREASHLLLDEANYGMHKFLTGIQTISLRLMQDKFPNIHSKKYVVYYICKSASKHDSYGLWRGMYVTGKGSTTL